jgi:hypothetical protein
MIFLSVSSFAQIFSVGARGGINALNVEVDQLIPPTGSEEQWHIFNDETSYGYHLGLYARLKILGLYVQPEFLLTTLNTKMVITELDPNNQPTGEEVEELRVNRFDVPILVGLKLGPFRANAGPVMSRNITTNSDLIQLEKATWGYQAGIGFDIWKILIDLKYEGAVSGRETTINFKGKDFTLDNRSSQLILSLGYRF